MKFWYKGEAFRLLPNIEISLNEDRDGWFIVFVWLKFVVTTEFSIW